MGVLERNFVQVFGPENAPVVMLGHGLGCDQRFWLPVASKIKSEFRVILFDYVGSGRADPTAYSVERYHRLDGYALDVLEVVEALQVSKVHFIGHSISSMIGLMAAVQQPTTFASLVMVAPSPRFLNDSESGYVGGMEESDIRDYLEVMDQNFLGWATAFSQMAAGSQSEASLHLFQSFCATDPRALRTFVQICLEIDCRSLLPKAPCPCTILQCQHDALAPVAVGEYMHQSLPGSHYEVLEVRGHVPHVTHPDLVSQRLRSHLLRWS